MAKVFLSKEEKQADNIIRRLPKQVVIAEALGESPQLIHYRLKNLYPRLFKEMIILLDLAGYEIKEK